MGRRSRKQGQVKRLGLLARKKWWLITGGVTGLLIVGIVAYALASVPLPAAAPGAQSTKILAVDGQVIARLHGDEDRTIVPLDAISMNLRNAVIATEDRKFYSHPGVSLKGILRAAFSNTVGGGVEQGGSTLTQQYVRNAFVQVGKERTIIRKIKEAIVAVKIERKYSKDKILEFYLNTVYFGRGAYGAEAAAKTYFDRSAKELDLGQAAYLAGVIRSPQRFQKERDPKAAVAIRDEVLKDMVAADFI
ncbi:MAG: biosynthetic peptidoglycan transglycosylase, partial [Actinomycetota bacterium]